MEGLKGWIKITLPKTAPGSITSFKRKHLSISYSAERSSCLKALHTTDQLFAFLGSVKHSVLFSWLKQHKKWGSLCVKTYLKYFYPVCVGSCPGTEPVTAVCSCTCENPQHAWPPTDRQVGAFHTKQVAELRPPFRQKLTWILLHKTSFMMIRF